MTCGPCDKLRDNIEGMDTVKRCSKEGCGYKIDARGLCSTHYLRFKKDGGLGVRCADDECGGYAITRGLCATHYEAARRRGDFSKCTFDGCERGKSGHGLCAAHLAQRRSRGEMVAINDPGQWGEWRVSHKGYTTRRRTVDGKRETQFQHRLLMEQELGRDLENWEEVHHKNGDRSDNRLENLEIWATKQPKGQRPEDKVLYAKEILERYAPELVSW